MKMSQPKANCKRITCEVKQSPLVVDCKLRSNSQAAAGMQRLAFAVQPNEKPGYGPPALSQSGYNDIDGSS
jgi:hypothetical protein